MSELHRTRIPNDGLVMWKRGTQMGQFDLRNCSVMIMTGEIIVFLVLAIFPFLLGYVTYHHVRSEGALLRRCGRWVRDVVDLLMGL
jgi:hypothetical protein